MSDPRTDQIAREAARLIDAGRARSIGEALRVAVDALGFQGVELPGHGRVRKHAGAMAMQVLGEAGYAREVRRVMEVAERLMTVIAELVPEVRQVLAGRAAAGQIDAGVTVHLRAYTRMPVAELAALLARFGYEEQAFETVNTRRGRLNRIRLEDEGLELVVTRCPPELAAAAGENLFTGRPIVTATLEELRAKLQA